MWTKCGRRTEEPAKRPEGDRRQKWLLPEVLAVDGDHLDPTKVEIVEQPRIHADPGAG